jgi:hypothetical protein
MTFSMLYHTWFFDPHPAVRFINVSARRAYFAIVGMGLAFSVASDGGI